MWLVHLLGNELHNITWMPWVRARLGAHDILETCDLTGVSQTGYDVICKK
jgi:hypothetical protein